MSWVGELDEEATAIGIQQGLLDGDVYVIDGESFVVLDEDDDEDDDEPVDEPCDDDGIDEPSDEAFDDLLDDAEYDSDTESEEYDEAAYEFEEMIHQYNDWVDHIEMLKEERRALFGEIREAKNRLDEMGAFIHDWLTEHHEHEHIMTFGSMVDDLVGSE